MHHKKRKPPAARAACKMCKPWKLNGAARTMEWKRTRAGAIEQVVLRELRRREDDGG